MLEPKPPELLTPGRKFLKEGLVHHYNPKHKKKKPRYIFLFNDCLLLTKKEGEKKHWLRFFVSLKSGLKVEDVLDSIHNPPDVEFRIYAPRKTIILFASSAKNKQDWLDAIRGCIGEIEARRNAPISLTDSTRRDESVEEPPLEDLPPQTANPSASPTLPPQSPPSQHQSVYNLDQQPQHQSIYGLPPGSQFQPMYVYQQPDGGQLLMPVYIPPGSNQSVVLQSSGAIPPGPVPIQGLPPGATVVQGLPPGAVIVQQSSAISHPDEPQQQQPQNDAV